MAVSEPMPGVSPYSSASYEVPSFLWSRWKPCILGNGRNFRLWATLPNILANCEAFGTVKSYLLSKSQILILSVDFRRNTSLKNTCGSIRVAPYVWLHMCGSLCVAPFGWFERLAHLRYSGVTGFISNSGLRSHG